VLIRAQDRRSAGWTAESSEVVLIAAASWQSTADAVPTTVPPRWVRDK
jgi:hypothetical protein